MLLKGPADGDADLWKVLQQRAGRRENIGLQVHQAVGRTSSPNITTKQMETGVYAAMNLGEFNTTSRAEPGASQDSSVAGNVRDHRKVP